MCIHVLYSGMCTVIYIKENAKSASALWYASINCHLEPKISLYIYIDECHRKSIGGAKCVKLVLCFRALPDHFLNPLHTFYSIYLGVSFPDELIFFQDVKNFNKAFSSCFPLVWHFKEQINNLNLCSGS